MTRANDELQTGVVSEQTDPNAANTFLSNQLIENNNNNGQDVGPEESAKTEEKVVTFVKKVKIEDEKPNGEILMGKKLKLIFVCFLLQKGSRPISSY